MDWWRWDVCASRRRRTYVLVTTQVVACADDARIPVRKLNRGYVNSASREVSAKGFTIVSNASMISNGRSQKEPVFGVKKEEEKAYQVSNQPIFFNVHGFGAHIGLVTQQLQSFVSTVRSPVVTLYSCESILQSIGVGGGLII